MKTGFALAAMLLAAACGDSGQATQEAFAEADARAAEDGRIDCAVEGAAELGRVCTIERISGGGEVSLVLRHPSGGFRRFLVATDGRGVAAADGAEPATVSVIADDRIEVAVAGDRYRLPASVKGR